MVQVDIRQGQGTARLREEGLRRTTGRMTLRRGVWTVDLPATTTARLEADARAFRSWHPEAPLTGLDLIQRALRRVELYCASHRWVTAQRDGQVVQWNLRELKAGGRSAAQTLVGWVHSEMPLLQSRTLFRFLEECGCSEVFVPVHGNWWPVELGPCGDSGGLSAWAAWVEAQDQNDPAARRRVRRTMPFATSDHRGGLMPHAWGAHVETQLALVDAEAR